MHKEGTTLDVLKEPHVEENHEEGANLQMLVKIYMKNKILDKNSLRLRGRMNCSYPS